MQSDRKLHLTPLVNRPFVGHGLDNKLQLVEPGLADRQWPRSTSQINSISPQSKLLLQNASFLLVCGYRFSSFKFASIPLLPTVSVRL